MPGHYTGRTPYRGSIHFPRKQYAVSLNSPRLPFRFLNHTTKLIANAVCKGLWWLSTRLRKVC
ncbi:hypothetical protein C1Y11_23910 [Pseudomonas sp. FW305-20]|nr:hypothetical protein C1Y11_23910 [Pseudomonas sp. FW305-20]PMU19498.1 hypothetical protein C1Y10_09805 [Pseudomonas sp. FW305-122]PMU35507.1 hypothetical protein C1Y12_25050 [Pseudomonas sp. FW305-47B]PMX57482.1 hypothetical protein C1Y13_24060 [Pseudomonas sp. FW305-33]PMX69492.1 hypothetical protein C1X12_08150 [Pseudomonas sp. FW305-60]